MSSNSFEKKAMVKQLAHNQSSRQQAQSFQLLRGARSEIERAIGVAAGGRSGGGGQLLRKWNTASAADAVVEM